MAAQRSRPPSARDLWSEANELMRAHPALLAAARGARGFGSGARWMRAAMVQVGWRLPPFGDESRYVRAGLAKYTLCLIGAGCVLGIFLIILAQTPLIALPFGLVAATVGFYSVEAQSVFLFPESLRGSRHPWASARGLSVAAGGTVRVMATVVPIALRMTTGWARPEGLVGAWSLGCLAIVLWHQRVARSHELHTEDQTMLPQLEIGPVNPVLLRREHIDAGLGQGFRVLWISDLHWRGPADTACLLALLQLARRHRPSAIVLGGDFVENDAAQPLFTRLVKNLARVAPCIALPGNHDRRRLAALRALVLDAGGVWLPDAGFVELVNRSGEYLRIRGEAAVPEKGDSRERPALSTEILCVHDPAELPRLSRSDSSGISPRVVLAGHLHGGQWVWRTSADGRIFPACWFYRYARLRENLGATTLLVGRGLGDTLPVRWRCPREVILCEVR